MGTKPSSSERESERIMAATSDMFTRVVQRSDRVIPRLVTHGRTQDERDVLSAILREVRRFGNEQVDGADIDKRGALGQALLYGVSERGWFGLTVPEKFDGAGLSLSASTRVINELCFFNGSLATCVALHSGLAMYSLLYFANEHLQQKYLPDIAAGNRIAAFCATEPEAGSDIGAMRTLLYRDGGQLKLRGSKCYVTNGGIAGILTVVASSPHLGGARSGHSLVLVDPSWPGVHRQSEEHKLGLKGSSTISIDFDDVLIADDHVIGQFSKGLDMAHEALTWGRTFMAAGCLGSARAAIAEAREHIGYRVQFGRTLDQFPLVRQQMASAIADAYAVEATLRLVCDTFDSGDAPIALESSILKVMASETSWNIIDRGIQLMGGAGFLEDTGMPRRLRDVRVTRIFEGANDVLQLHLASATLKWSRTSLTQMPSLTPLVAKQFSAYAQTYDKVAQQLGNAIAAVQKKYAFRLFEQQMLQENMAKAIIATYGLLAVVLRVCATMHQNSEQTRPAEMATASLAAHRLACTARHAIEEMQFVQDNRTDDLVGTVLADETVA